MLFLILSAWSAVVSGASFSAVMTIENLDKSCLQASSKNAIVATAMQMLGEDVSVTFANSVFSETKKGDGVGSPTYTNVVTLAVTANLVDFPLFTSDDCLSATLSSNLQSLAEVNAVYRANVWKHKANEISDAFVTSFTGFTGSSMADACGEKASSLKTSIKDSLSKTSKPSRAELNRRLSKRGRHPNNATKKQQK